MKLKTTTLFLAFAAAFANLSNALGQEPKAKVRDAVYRGTLVCSKLPFVAGETRTSIEATVTGNSVRYRRPVVLAKGGVQGYEDGTGSIDGEKIAIVGAWKSDSMSYQAAYSGNFVRRSAKLSGTQTWTRDGKTFTRTCSGSIKRPLAAFLPSEKKN